MNPLAPVTNTRAILVTFVIARTPHDPAQQHVSAEGCSGRRRQFTWPSPKQASWHSSQSSVRYFFDLRLAYSNR